MPRFYFNIEDDTGIIADDEGMDLPDVAAARLEAESSAREILAESLRANKEVDGKTIEVWDETGAIILAFKIRDILN